MRNRAFIGLYLIMAVLLVLPFVLPNSFYMDLAIRMAINAVIVLSLNLLIGFAGQISLGHAGFLGIIINIVLCNEAALTGGPDGMPVPAMALLGYELSGDTLWYWLVAGLLSLAIWASLNLIDSPFGRALRALHGAEVASQVVGVNVVRYKVSIFLVSAVIASIMGSITAHYVGFVTPNVADFFHSLELVTMVVIGGMASVYGSVVGAVLLTVLPQALTSLEGWETVAFGTILMLCMIFLPIGLVPTLVAKFVRGE
ncbi:MAG: branched-chain amino acid ABC transporter permease [Comamonadaceae bacterium CG_4_9_14_3_um_filter_60_33]|nr:MAG: branched-chain amino acid ABC transporter permease [Comamonadaceae bacterium CG_4_9_14_3_um_filter_60_33]